MLTIRINYRKLSRLSRLDGVTPKQALKETLEAASSAILEQFPNDCAELATDVCRPIWALGLSLADHVGSWEHD